MAELGAFAKIKLDPSDCPVQFATVYEDRAEVSRLFVVKAEPRTVYEISLVGLTAAMEPSSVRVGGQMTILEVSSEMKAPSASAEDEAGAAEGDLSRQLEAEKRAQTEQKIARLERERDLLGSLADGAADRPRAGSAAPGPKVFGVEDAERMEAFLGRYSTRSAALDGELGALRKRKAILAHRVRLLLSRVASDAESRPATVTVTVVAQSGEEVAAVPMRVSYVVSNASWEPSYDARASVSAGTLRVTYFGSIRQSTGEDWRGCRITLSTARPSVGGEPPKLGTLHVGMKQRWGQRKKRMSLMFGGASASKKQDRSLPSGATPKPAMGLLDDALLDELDDLDEAPAEEARVLSDTEGGGRGDESKAQESTVLGEGGGAAFEIARPATVLCDSKPHRVTVRVLELPSTFVYHVSPSVSEHAYLKAITTNTSEFPLLPSTNVSVFLGNSFVATTSIEFSMFLGVDSTVNVKSLPPQKMVGRTGWSSKGKRDTESLVTEITNTRAEKATVCLVQALPLSSDHRVKVSVEKPSEDELRRGNRLRGLRLDGEPLKAESDGGAGSGEVQLSPKREVELLEQPHTWLDASVNHVEWIRHLEAGETRRIQFAYTVEYTAPPGMRLVTRW